MDEGKVHLTCLCVYYSIYICLCVGVCVYTKIYLTFFSSPFVCVREAARGTGGGGLCTLHI